MPHVIQPARDVLYAAYNPIYAVASYPVLSREWLNQQTKSEAQLRRENTAMQAELLQAQVRLQKLSELICGKYAFTRSIRYAIDH